MVLNSGFSSFFQKFVYSSENSQKYRIFDFNERHFARKSIRFPGRVRRGRDMNGDYGNTVSHLNLFVPTVRLRRSEEAHVSVTPIDRTANAREWTGISKHYTITVYEAL